MICLVQMPPDFQSRQVPVNIVFAVALHGPVHMQPPTTVVFLEHVNFPGRIRGLWCEAEAEFQRNSELVFGNLG